MDNNKIKEFLENTFCVYKIKFISSNIERKDFNFNFEAISNIENEKVQLVANIFFEYFNLLKIKIGSNVIDNKKYENSMSLLLENFLVFLDNGNLNEEQNYNRTIKIMSTYSRFQKEFVNSFDNIYIANKLLKSYSKQLRKNGYFEIN